MVTLEEKANEIISYFTNPAATGYTTEKTIIFALLLIGVAYVLFEILRKIKLRVDQRFAIGIIPYVFLGALLRSLEDAQIFTSYWLITPGIYVLVTAAFLVTLMSSLLIEKKFGVPYFKILFVVGLLSFAFLLPLLKFVNLDGMLLIALFYLPWLIILYKINWGLGNKLVTSAQMLDATATFVAIQFFGYVEKHVFGSFVIGSFSPAFFIVVKIIGIVVILKLLDKFGDDKEFTNYLKLLIAVLGLATGFRDFLSLSAFV